MFFPKKIIIGTRGSPLAVAQSGLFADSLKRIYPDLNIEFQKITTSGDRIQDRFLNTEGGKGLFVKEIEEALQRKEIDLAVHSLKDLPAHTPSEFQIACLPKRLSYEDVLIAGNHKTLEQLKEGAVIGTTSLRRRLQLARLRPDLRFEVLRGNIDTRLKKIAEGKFDGIVLAKAGMLRLGVDLSGVQVLPIIPAPGQGCLAIEIRQEDEVLQKLLQPLNDHETALAVQSERRVMQELGGDCNLPLGALGEINGEELELSAFIASPDGSDWIEEKISGPAENPVALADQLLEMFWKKGAKEIINKIREL